MCPSKKAKLKIKKNKKAKNVTVGDTMFFAFAF